MSKNPCFRGHFEGQHGKWVETLLQSKRQHLNHNPNTLITEKVIVLEKVSFSDMENLALFVNTLTGNDKYSLIDRDTLTQPIQMQLSQKLQLSQM